MKQYAINFLSRKKLSEAEIESIIKKIEEHNTTVENSPYLTEYAKRKYSISGFRLLQNKTNKLNFDYYYKKKEE